MNTIFQLAGNRLIAFVLMVILIWFVIGGIVIGTISVIFDVPATGAVAQSLGSLSATAFILGFSWYLGWLRPEGIANPGPLRAWLVSMAALIYLILVYWLVFFGDISFDLSILSTESEARSLLLRQLVVGLVEEILFRGVVLYALVRVWGKTNRGIVRSILVAAFLFGVFHLLQAFTGSSFKSALIVSLESFVSAIWWSVIVLLWLSIWPVVVIHAVSNYSVLLRLLAKPGMDLADSAYLLAIVFQLPLIFVFGRLLLRSFPRPSIPETPHFSDNL